MNTFSFDQLPDIISNCTEYKDKPITFTDQPSIDLSTEELKITSDLSITFPTHEFTCKRICISNCKVEFRNLLMSGSIRVENGTLSLFDSNIHDPDASMDYIISTQSNSSVSATNCHFSGTTHFGISGDEHSTLSFDHCTFQKIALYSIALTCFSLLKCNETTFQDLDADSILVSDHCGANIVQCQFIGNQKRAVTVKNADYLVFDHSLVKNCSLSAFYVSNCEQFLMRDSTIMDCLHTAMYLEHVTGVIKKTIVSNCNGNGVNASHSTKVLVSKCTFNKTTFPSIAICESSFGSVQKCEISDSEMSGLIVRSNSNASIEKTTIRNAKLFGISISDSKEVIVENSFIIGCEQSAVSVYNNSRIKVKSTNLIGPCKYGIICFTGGFVNAIDTTILGMSECSIWLHHSGSGIFEKLIFSPEQIREKSDISSLIERFNSSDSSKDGKKKVDMTKIVRNESKRFYVVKNSFIVGYGQFEEHANIDAEQAPSGQKATKPKCILCGEDASDCFYSRCGHAVYCRKCYDKMDPKPETCQFCLMPVSGVTSPINLSLEDDEGICSICFTNEIDSIILPCGHTICYECAVHWFQTSIECPFCREKNARAQLFLSYE